MSQGKGTAESVREIDHHRPLAGRRALVLGLGRFGGGVGVTRWLVGEGAEVRVTDLAPPESLQESLRQIEDLPVRTNLGGHDLVDLAWADFVVVNPAVPKRRSPFFQEIVRRQTPWTTEINLFCARCPARIIGVTGSFGKSTTCAMIAEILKRHDAERSDAPSNVFLGGNFGGSLLLDLKTMTPEDWVVLELSSAQLEDLPRIPWAPDLAVLTNLLPHHTERYDEFGDYVSAKLNILATRDRGIRLVSGPIDPDAELLVVRALERGGHSRVRVDPAPGSFKLKVRGRHNQLNARCAQAVGGQLGIPDSVITTALGDFTGLPHRLELVAQRGEVEFYNDSKSTAPPATLTALAAMNRPVVLIVGGRTSTNPGQDWAVRVMNTARVVICTGEAGPTISNLLRKVRSSDESIRVADEGSLAQAVQRAAELARPGEAVLYSPGGTSFDQYANFVERGDHFRRLVRELPPTAPGESLDSDPP